MGILRNGFFTRGYKTSSEIDSLTGMESGDTVFDTTFNIRKIFDGNRWVSSVQISLISDGIPTGGSQANGSCSTVSSSNDFRIQSAISPTNDVNLIGAVQQPSGSVAVGSFTVLQFAGVCNVATWNATVARGNFIDLHSVYGRAGATATPGVGTFGVWLSNGLANSATRAFIRPIETN